MSVYVITPNLIANGNINVSSFVKLDTSNDEYVLQADAGDVPLGVSGSATFDAPGTTGATGYDAQAGDNVLVYGPGSIVQLTVGTGGWTRGNFLKPEAVTGYGVPITNTNDIPGAYAFESASAGEYSRVLVLPPRVPTAAVTVTATAVDLTLTSRDSGKIIIVTAADKTVTLPTAAAGLRYAIIASGTGATGGSTGTTVAVQAGDYMHGNGFTAAAGKGAVNTHATARDGDNIQVVGNGIDGWNILTVLGTWDRVA